MMRQLWLVMVEISAMARGMIAAKGCFESGIGATLGECAAQFGRCRMCVGARCREGAGICVRYAERTVYASLLALKKMSAFALRALRRVQRLGREERIRNDDCFEFARVCVTNSTCRMFKKQFQLTALISNLLETSRRFAC
jgi:hypothetical protein